jgi:hypothetical protein
LIELFVLTLWEDSTSLHRLDVASSIVSEVHVDVNPHALRINRLKRRFWILLFDSSEQLKEWKSALKSYGASVVVANDPLIETGSNPTREYRSESRADTMDRLTERSHLTEDSPLLRRKKAKVSIPIAHPPWRSIPFRVYFCLMFQWWQCCCCAAKTED